MSAGERPDRPPVEAVKENAWREIAAIDAALAAGEIDDAGWHAAVAGIVGPAYLSAQTPWGQSGKTGDERAWEDARRFVLDAFEGDADLLDVGCANGYLMETLHRWAAHDGRRVEPYGLDIVPELAALARARLPHWADRIWAGNALDWVAPRRFDVVRAGLEYVPAHRRSRLVGHLLETAVAAGGRLVIGPSTEEVSRPGFEDEVRSFGYVVAGRAERPHRDDRVVRRLFWLQA